MLISDWSSDVCSSDLIKKHPGVAEVYGARLIAEGVIAQGWIAERIKQFTTLFEGEFEAGQSYLPNKADWFAGRWSGLQAPADSETARRNVEAGITRNLIAAPRRPLNKVPDRKNRRAH